MRERRLARPRPLAATAILSAIAAAVASALACSLIVSDTLPPYSCSPAAGSAACPSGQVCAPNPQDKSSSTCQPFCNSSSCRPGFMCDEETHLCTAAFDASSGAGQDAMGDDGGPIGDGWVLPSEGGANDADSASSDGMGPCRGVGCRCTTFADCDNSHGYVCADQQAVTSDIWNIWLDAGASGDGGRAGFCVQPCCTSGDCDMTTTDGGVVGNVCFATGAGGSYCVPPNWLGDRSALGSVGAGQPCSGGAGSCRSGLCLDSGVCADTCCSSTSSSTDCATGAACHFGPFPGSGFDTHLTASCAPSNANGASGGSFCIFDSDCKSNLCVTTDAGFMSTSTCRDACRTPADCSSRTMVSTCGYVQPYLPMTDAVLAACIPSSFRVGDAGDGTSCRFSTDCARGYCALLASGQNTCLSVCFTESPGSSKSDCPATEHCRPQRTQLDNGSVYSVLACGM